MAVNVAVGSITIASTDTVGTTKDFSFGASFDFKFCILQMSGAASLDSSGARSARWGVGFGTGSAARRAMCYGTDNGAGNATLSIRQSESAVLVATGATGALDIETEASWPANNIRFIVDQQFGATVEVIVICVGGSDITSQKVGTFQEAATDVTDPGFQPTGMLFTSVGFATAPDSAGAAQGCMSLGASDGTRSWVAYVGGDDNANTMDNVSYMKSGEVIAMGPEPAVTLDARASVSSFDSSGVNLSWAESVTTRYVFYLAWAGGQFRVDNFTTATDTNNFSDTGYGFQGKGAVFVSCSRAESTADTPTAHNQVSMGAATSSSNRVALGFTDEDAIGTSVVHAWCDSDQIYRRLNETTQALEGLMDFVSFDSDGMTLVMDDADPSANFVGVAVWGDNAVAGAAPITPYPFQIVKARRDLRRPRG